MHVFKFNFPFCVNNGLEKKFSSLLQGFSKCACISNFLGNNFLTLRIIVYRRVHLSCILRKLGHFLLRKRKISYDPAAKPLSNYFAKRFLFCQASCDTNRGDKIILNIFDVAQHCTTLLNNTEAELKKKALLIKKRLHR